MWERLKIMDKYRVLITLRDYDYFKTIQPSLEYLNEDKYEILFLSYEKLSGINNLFTVKRYFENEIEAEKYLLENSQIAEMYRCDPRHFFGIKTESELIVEQANIEKYFRDFIEKNKIDIIFSGYASYGIWTIPHEIAKSKMINSYRMFDFGYLNIDLSTPRTWFTQDIYMESWEKKEHRFNWESDKVSFFIEEYIKGVENNNIVLSQTAMPHRDLFYANSVFLLLKNFIRIFLRKDNQSIHRIRSVFSLYLTKRKQTRLKDLEFNYLIYPLNAAFDEQLLLRGTYIKDIYSSIQMLCNALPLGMKLVIRQHPVDPGGLSYKKINELLSKNKNLHIVDHNIPLNELIIKSQGMITVNSTSAFDSLINKKPVFVLGRTYYSNSKAVTTIKDIRNLTQEINHFIKKGFELEQINSFKEILKNICYESYPEPKNLDSGDYHEHLGLAIKAKLEIMEK